MSTTSCSWPPPRPVAVRTHVCTSLIPQTDRPFSITTELADCPWNPKHRLALVGLQGRDIPDEELPPRNLVFLIDVYIDSLNEARKVLVKEAGGTLVTIAKDVKIQVEFNPATVSAYRLIGYQNRMLRSEDFNDDKKDAGEIGAGHSVTAVYEIVPAGVDVDLPPVDPLKYQRGSEPAAAAAAANELATVKLRYKAPESDTSQLLSIFLRNESRPLSANLGFASAVVEFGMLLRQSKHAGNGTLESAVARARRFRGEDPEGNRAEFVKLVELAASLRRMQLTP